MTSQRIVIRIGAIIRWKESGLHMAALRLCAGCRIFHLPYFQNWRIIHDKIEL